MLGIVLGNLQSVEMYLGKVRILDVKTFGRFLAYLSYDTRTSMHFSQRGVPFYLHKAIFALPTYHASLISYK